MHSGYDNLRVNLDLQEYSTKSGLLIYAYRVEKMIEYCNDEVIQDFGFIGSTRYLILLLFFHFSNINIAYYILYI